jgi:alpha-glucosidase
MSAKQPRDLALPLSFLGKGKYQVDLWRDAPDAEVDPNHLITQHLSFSSDDTLKVHVALDGGFVARLTR